MTRPAPPPVTGEAMNMGSIKSLLVGVGRRSGDRFIHQLDSALSYVTVGHWAAARGFRVAAPVSNREELFVAIAREVVGRRVLYLEFGVAFGDSIRFWSDLLEGPDASLHGFDSFEGLPEDWNRYTSKGAYSTGGVIPDVKDERVRFFKGLFDETLPDYELPDHDVLIVNVDCDIYPSASFVLGHLAPHIGPGTYIYFDEFCDRENELRAFDEFLETTGKRFEIVGATADFRHAAFKCVG
jgi:hypothetical protein